MSSSPPSSAGETPSDALLLSQYFKNGDRDAMNVLFERHAGMAYRIAYAETQNSADAEEAVQAAFVYVLQHGGQEIHNVRGWLMKIVVHACLDKKKEEARRKNRQEAAAQQPAVVSEPNGEKAELISAALSAVQALPKLYRLPVWLHYLEGCSFEDVAITLSIKEKTVREQVRRGIDQVRQSLEASGFTASAVALPGLLASIPLAPAPTALTASIKALAATKAAGAGATLGSTKGGLALMAKASIGLAVVTVTSVTALMLSNGRSEDAPKAPPEKPPAGDTAKTTAAPASDLEKYFEPQRDWPRFRGPLGSGQTPAKGLPVKWDAKTGQNIIWSVEIANKETHPYPFHPFASPIVYQDKIFIVQGNVKPNAYNVSCFNKADGKKLWQTPLDPPQGPEWKPGAHEDENSPVASTPCTDGERLYVLLSANWGFGASFTALDYQGKVVWKQDLSYEFCWTTATSPVIYKDMVILVCILQGQKKGGQGAVVAFDRKTGAIKYTTPRHEVDNYSASQTTPLQTLLNGTPQFMINTHWSIEGINPEDGKTKWVVNHRGDKGRGTQVCSSMGIGNGAIYSDGCVGFALSLDTLASANGDITDKVLWKKPFPAKKGIEGGELGAGVSGSSIICNGYLFRLDDQSAPDAVTLRCIEMATGNEMYAENLGPNKHYAPMPLSVWASPFATADGYVYFASSAKSMVIKAGPKYELAGASDLDDGHFHYPPVPKSYPLNSAAISEDRIYIQGHNKLWCIGNK